MLQLLLYGLLAIVLAVGLFFLATWLLPSGEQIAPPLRDEAPWQLPSERAMQAVDIDSIRLPVALRGYRFAETDLLLDRLATELRARDEEIAQLRERVPHPSPAPEPDEAYAPPAVTPPPPPVTPDDAEH